MTVYGEREKEEGNGNGRGPFQVNIPSTECN